MACARNGGRGKGRPAASARAADHRIRTQIVPAVRVERAARAPSEKQILPSIHDRTCLPAAARGWTAAQAIGHAALATVRTCGVFMTPRVRER